ncbi:MAG: HAMP domain-containing histidine kinase [Bacteroidales bacterium]|jgi:signal transduction histidine kinase|nr:HAMP domain-containing histidine kinase [Bacteroidales bacterium]
MKNTLKYLFSKRAYRLPLILLCLFIFAQLVEHNVLFKKFDRKQAEKTQRIFLNKEYSLYKYMDIVEQRIDMSNPDSAFVAFHAEYRQSAEEQGLSILVYRNDSLYYWSTHNIPASQTFSQSNFSNPYINIENNGSYASFVQTYKNYNIVGLILIKNIYRYSNEYLQRGFQEDFGLPEDAKVFPELRQGYYPICDSRGKFIWALIFDSSCHYPYQTIVPAVTYLIILLFFFVWVDSLFSRRKKFFSVLLALMLIVLRCLIQYFRVPINIYELAIFDPVHFASDWYPSLGDLLLWVIFVSFLVYEFYRNFHVPVHRECRWKYLLCVIFMLTLAVSMFFSTGLLIRTLVINSSEMFEAPDRSLLLNGFSLLGYIAVMLTLCSFCLLLDKTLKLCLCDVPVRHFPILYLIVLAVVTLLWLSAGWYVNIFSVLILSATVTLMGLIRRKTFGAYKYAHIILIMLLLTVYITLFVHSFSTVKYNDRKRVIVTNLASPHDLTSEFLLRDVSERIISDTILTDIIYEKRQGEVLEYIQQNYFYGSYWNTYENYQCVVCGGNDQLELSNGMAPNCIGYFRQMIENSGTQLPRSQFYYINRQQTDLLASYLGWFWKEKDGQLPLHLFIELWTGGKGMDGIGYPELLLDSRTNKENNLKGYAHAKYHNNRRISQAGFFNYNFSGDVFSRPSQYSDYYSTVSDGIEHLVYHHDKNTMIVLSSSHPSLPDIIYNFSYLFIFSFLAVSIGSLIYLPAHKTFRWNLQNKIQISMILIIVISFCVVGIYTFFHINSQYLEKHNDYISGKMQSVYRELQKVLNGEQTVVDKNELADWLLLFRGMFSTDINIFDTRGQLIASSLPEVFDRGLVSRQINPDAFIRLSFGQRASILENEKIGRLKYISAYEPFVDNNNNVIAFLNLPYFTQQDDLREEISELMIAITNFYIIVIFLTVLVSVFIGNQITQPLTLLQEKFKNIKLGEKNEPIHYFKNDEIGRLVKEYNRAIEELARSAGRLARSERETAWREMAKQIAHEINNPLTPMKLSIQHLKRAWDNHSNRFNEYMEKIPHSLIEQIDTLSAIATEFSNFAKMPSVNNQPMDVIRRINDVIPLYATGDNKRAFHTDFHGLDRAMVFADKEQISRVFINLLKNALQAIPKERKPLIFIDVLKLNRFVWIRIKDNGTGIPDDMQEKIFQPNFTTKSSGMGIGLSIVRSIIEDIGGTISFRTKPNEGTTFIISLPAYEEDDPTAAT